MPMDFSEMTLEEVLCSYSSVKGHHTRCEKEIVNLHQLLNTQYSSTSEERINDRLEKLEKYTHKLSDITDYLVTQKYAKARDHQKEVKHFSDVVDKCSTNIFTVLHNRHATAQAVAIPTVQPAPVCPSSSFTELKLEKLQHDASAATFRTWKKQIKTYFDATQIGSLPCSQQQAYLNNYLDDVLRARVDRRATGTTPVYCPILGLFTCVTILDNTFLESYPIHLRRKQFFDACQKEGQSVVQFRVELLSLFNEADSINIRVNNLICMMLQIGISDPALQRELGSIQNPTLAAFNDKLEGYKQARRTTNSTAFGNAASRAASNRHPPAQNSRPNIPRGQGERDRRIALRGKSFTAQKAIIYCLSACTRKELRAIFAMPWVILLRLVDIVKMLSMLSTSNFHLFFPRNLNLPSNSRLLTMAVRVFQLMVLRLLGPSLLLPPPLFLLLHMPVLFILPLTGLLQRCLCD